ncbi:MAG: AbrB/MazE/SpoVT family DNA-binding domain-containing protein [Bdellovibrionota bacterium]
MRSKINSKGQITIPRSLRKKFGFNPGQFVEFDPDAPFLKVVKEVDKERMRSVIGRLKDVIDEDIDKILDDFRGKVDLP